MQGLLAGVNFDLMYSYQKKHLHIKIKAEPLGIKELRR